MGPLSRGLGPHLVEHRSEPGPARWQALKRDANPPAEMHVDVLTTQGQRVSYTLVTTPPYLCWNLGAILGA